MKKSLIIFALLASCILLLISCGEGVSTTTTAQINESNPAVTTTGTPATTAAPVVFVGTDISEFKIIRADGAGADEKIFFVRIQETIEKYAGVTLAFGTDYAKPGDTIDNEAFEILIGNTNRQASIDALAELNTKKNANFMLKFDGTKLVVVGKDEKAVCMGVKALEERVIEKSQKKGFLPIKEGYSFVGNETYDYVFSNGVTLKTEYIRPISLSNSKAQYTTLAVLEHNGKDNGTMFATYEGANFTIYKSTDDGRTWKKASGIGGTKSAGGFLPKWMPCLYELPADIGDYKEGTMIFSCTTANSTSNSFSKSAISIYASEDLCKTWKAVSEVAVAGGGSDYASDPDKGVWEPMFLYEESNGRLYCFYSDDSDPDHDQKLVCKWTDDLVNWSELIDNVTVPESNKRPGMTAAVKMNNGEYYICYEFGLDAKKARPDYPVYWKTTKNLDTWDYESWGTKLETKDGVTYGGAPWCAYTPVGGECGTLFVIGSSQKTGDKTTGKRICVSFDYGRTYESIPNFVDMTGGNGYSPWLHFSEDGETLYYVCCPKGENGNYNVVMAKVTIKK